MFYGSLSAEAATFGLTTGHRFANSVFHLFRLYILLISRPGMTCIFSWVVTLHPGGSITILIRVAKHPLSHFIMTGISIQQFMFGPIFSEVILEHIRPQFPGIRPPIASCQFKFSPKFICRNWLDLEIVL